MAQTGYTPILIYASGTTTNVPSASNLTSSSAGAELAINYTDGKLFYKDNSGNVQVIGWKTTPVSAGGTGLTTATGVLVGAGSTVSAVAAGTSGNVLTSNGTTWTSSAPSASGATITGTTTSGTYYIVGTTSTSGTLSTASISNTNAVSYNANTGALTAVSVVSSSDERTKENWVDLPKSFLENLANVKYGTYSRIGKNWREVGVSAQSLKEVLPEAVAEDDFEMLSVSYGNAALVAAIELAKEVKLLRAEIETLKSN